MTSLAKMNNAKKARQVCSDARDILGGNGILLEYHVARHYSDMEGEITGLNAFGGWSAYQLSYGRRGDGSFEKRFGKRSCFASTP